jgi:hypothetical protein
VAKHLIVEITITSRDNVKGGWRKLHNEELHNMFCLPSIIRMASSWRVRRTGHVVLRGKRGLHMGYLWESQKERDH